MVQASGGSCPHAGTGLHGGDCTGLQGCDCTGLQDGGRIRSAQESLSEAYARQGFLIPGRNFRVTEALPEGGLAYDESTGKNEPDRQFPVQHNDRP